MISESPDTPEIEEHALLNRLLRAQTEVMRAHASGDSLTDLYERIIELLEEEIEGSRGSILLANHRAGTLTFAAAPRLPKFYVENSNGAPIGQFGTCARAAFEARRVVVRDALVDPSWEAFRDIAEEFELRASWSQPFYGLEDELLGTIGLYFRTPRDPSSTELDVLTFAANLTGVLTSHAQAQADLVESESKFRTLVESASDAILLLTEEGRIAYAGPQVQDLFGTHSEALAGSEFEQIVAEGQRSIVRIAMATTLAEQTRQVVEEVHSANDEEQWLRLSLAPRTDRPGVIVIASDISRRKAIESHIKFTERMTTVGTLAAGVAHEINNPVAYILGNLSYIEDSLEESTGDLDEVLEAVRDSIEGANRVTEIVNDLGQFARSRDDVQTTRVGVASVLRRCVRLAGHEVERHAKLGVTISSEPEVRANESELAQMILHLIINAAQAVDFGGTVEVTLRSEDRFCVLEVCDDGPGIDESIQDRIYEPFFTTKGPDEGTGLGLSVVHGIVERHSGTIGVERSPLGGACFVVRLPLSS